LNKLLLSAAASAVLSLVAAPALAGNGAPSGSHYNLNLIGVGPKTNMPANSSGNVIFVSLQGNTKINLCESGTVDPCAADGFYVLDKNGTDGTAAFALPNPDPTNSGTTSYSVFARALGTPGGSSVTTTCATDPSTGETVCSQIYMTLNRTTGKSIFTNVSKDLLYIYADINNDGTLDRVPLFDSQLQDYFWSYDNNNLRLAQLRFYPCATVVPDATDPNGAQVDTSCFTK